MKKRNPQEFIATAETEIDLAWRRLPILYSDRPTALLKLITATDDRMRITALSGTPSGVFFSTALRFSQDALIFGIPWIFSTCRTISVPIPSIVTEADFAEGNALAEYAEAYDSAVLAFTNYHQGRFDAFVAAKDRRITFVQASPEVELAELERKAYEMHELGLEAEGSPSVEARLESMHSLLVETEQARNFRPLDRFQVAYLGKMGVQLVKFHSKCKGGHCSSINVSYRWRRMEEIVGMAKRHERRVISSDFAVFHSGQNLRIVNLCVVARKNPILHSLECSNKVGVNLQVDSIAADLVPRKCIRGSAIQ